MTKSRWIWALRIVTWTSFLVISLMQLWSGGIAQLSRAATDNASFSDFLTDGEWLSAWSSQSDIAGLIIAAARPGLIAVNVYLLGTTLLGLACRLSGHRTLIAVSDAITVAAVRRMLTAMAGASMAVAPSIPASGQWSAGTIPPQESAVTPTTVTTTPTIRRLHPVVPPIDASPSDEPLNSPYESKIEPPAKSAETWLVEPGDNLWSISATTLSRRWHRSPTDREVFDYWNELININRAHFLDQQKPGLIFAGQVFQLPDTAR